MNIINIWAKYIIYKKKWYIKKLNPETRILK